MPVNLSVKNVPDSLAESLRRRAKRHHRSLQGELMAILQAVVAADAPASAREGRTKTPAQLFDELAAMGTGTPAESAAIIRKSRSSR